MSEYEITQSPWISPRAREAADNEVGENMEREQGQNSGYCKHKGYFVQRLLDTAVEEERERWSAVRRDFAKFEDKLYAAVKQGSEWEAQCLELQQQLAAAQAREKDVAAFTDRVSKLLSERDAAEWIPTAQKSVTESESALAQYREGK